MCRSVPVPGSGRTGIWEAARSVSVVQVLIDNSSVESRRFRATSFGEYRPIRENDSAENRQRNRRVEIYVRYTELMQGGGRCTLCTGRRNTFTLACNEIKEKNDMAENELNTPKPGEPDASASSGSGKSFKNSLRLEKIFPCCWLPWCFRLGAAYTLVDENYERIYVSVFGGLPDFSAEYPMEDIVVNPARSNGQRFLVIGMSLELSSPPIISPCWSVT